VARYLYWEARTREETRSALERKVRLTQLAREGDSVAIAVILPDAEGTSTGVIGDLSFWLQSEEHRGAEIGYVFNPRFGGKGYATEAVGAMVDAAFHHLGMHRIYGRADARNTDSIALMRRLDMRQEAYFVKNEWFKGEWSDEVVLAILEDEWQERAARR
jgi:RimJ/RimL family protein N-acetyltransferase